MLITIYSNICFECIKETSLEEVSLTHSKRMFDRKKPCNDRFLGYLFLYPAPYN